jgi:diaminohydroxyphosphoribosylaminopyrimidine deaminase / 5-amino-6-(5-phosphoribosylamino)uracil reductase
VDRHEAQMRRALELAERGWGRVSPNPLVGAVLVRDGRVVGEGWHQGPGTDHAEVVALREAGMGAAGATLYCSLEPCDRFGRTPPCTRALIEAGIVAAIVAATDPNLGEHAPGLHELREAGVEVSVGPLQAESRRLNEAFEHHVVTGSPFVTLKMAASLDGKTAASDGSSRWISGEPARADVQRLRAGADAVIVGAGTAATDDPALTVRDPRFAQARPPLRVIVDGSGRVPATGRLFDEAAPTVIATTDRVPERAAQDWTAAGAELLVLDRDPDGHVSLPALLHVLGKRDVQGVLVEGGATLAGAFAAQGLIDKVIVYLAPKLVGGAAAPGILAGEGFAPIGRAVGLELRPVERLGEDLKVEGYVHRDR